MLELHALRQFLGFAAQASLFLDRVFATHLDVGQHTNGVALDGFEQILEQGEGLALVFLLGVLLGVATQMDAVTQMIHGRQVVLPQVVQHPQYDLLLEAAQRLGAGHLLLLPVGIGQHLQDAFAQGFLVQLVVFVEPLLHRQLRSEIAVQYCFEARDVPLFRQRLRRNVLVDRLLERFATELGDSLANLVGCQQAVAHVVDDLALLVGDVIVFEQLLAHVEVASFDLALGFLDGVGDHAMLDGLAGFHAQRLHEVLHPIGSEDAHEAVFQRQVEAAGAGIALTTGAATQLVVDAARLVTLGSDHMQPARLENRLMALLPIGLDLRDLLLGGILHRRDFDFPVAAQQDVGTTAGHVGGDGDRTRATGLGDDLGFLVVVLGVEHLVLDAFLLQQARDVFGAFDGRRAHQDRAAIVLTILDVGDDRRVLLFLGQVDQVVVVLACQRLVGRDDHHRQVVDLHELEGFGVGGAGHSRELLVQAEVVLEGGRGQRLALGLDRQPLLRLDGLVQAFGQATPGHGAAGVLVDQQHLVVLHDVFDVAMEQLVRTQAGVDVGQQPQVVRRIEGFAFGEQAGLGQHFLDELVALLVELDLAGLLVDAEMPFLGDDALFFLDVLLERRDQLVDLLIELGAVLGLAGNDQRRARLVDEDGVHFVDHREIEFTLMLVLETERHVVAQVVEAEFVVGAVGDVGGIGGALFFRRLERRDDTDRETEELVQRAHPVGVAAGQVVVHRDHVNALAGECVEVHRQGRHQGLALAGAHFGDLAFVQRHAADQLYVEVTHAHHALAGFTADRESLWKNLVECFAFGEAGLELFGLVSQLLIGQRQHLLFECIDGLDRLEHALDLTLILASKEFLH